MTKQEATTLVQALAFNRADISTLLDASAGLDSSATPTYRPYAVAAFLWITSKNTQRLHEAEGAVFDDPQRMIAGLLASQAPFDIGLTIPEGWSVSELRAMTGAPTEAAVVF